MQTPVDAVDVPVAPEVTDVVPAIVHPGLGADELGVPGVDGFPPGEVGVPGVALHWLVEVGLAAEETPWS